MLNPIKNQKGVSLFLTVIVMATVLAIVFGILSLRRIAAPQSNARGEGLAACGIVLGIIYAIIAGIALFILMKNPALLEQILKGPLPR